MKGEMMHRLLLVMPSILVILLGTSVLSLATPSPDDLADDPLTSFIEKNGGGGTGDGTKAGQVQNNGAIRNLEVIGHNDIGNRGFNADIYAYKGFAYIGQWGFGISNIPKFCPSRSEEHTSELQSRVDIVCRLLLEKKK